MAASHAGTRREELGWGQQKEAVDAPMHNVDTAGKATFPEEDGRGQEQPATVRENNQPITANAPSKPPLTLRADPFWLEQTLANLLENAIRAAPEGSTLDLHRCTDPQPHHPQSAQPHRSPHPRLRPAAPL